MMTITLANKLWTVLACLLDWLIWKLLTCTICFLLYYSNNKSGLKKLILSDFFCRSTCSRLCYCCCLSLLTVLLQGPKMLFIFYILSWLLLILSVSIITTTLFPSRKAKLLRKFPGPRSLPIVGNALEISDMSNDCESCILVVEYGFSSNGFCWQSFSGSSSSPWCATKGCQSAGSLTCPTWPWPMWT